MSAIQLIFSNILRINNGTAHLTLFYEFRIFLELAVLTLPKAFSLIFFRLLYFMF